MSSCSIDELEAPCIEIKTWVKKKRAVLPASSTPTHSLYLSNLDDMIGTRFLTPTIYFYSRKDPLPHGGLGAGKVMRRALSQVLVPYYPLAGRLRDVGGGKLEVACTAAGAFFVEATTDLALEDLGSLAMPNPSWKPFVYCFPGEEHLTILDLPLLIAQVTYFKCGGFALGLRICHCICDGMGAMQFMNAWAEMVRGATFISINPCWEREKLKPRSPPLTQFKHMEFENIEDNSNLIALISKPQLVQKGFCFNHKFQASLKEQVFVESGMRCTTFEVMAAHVWRSWVRALQITPRDQEMRLTFATNGRSVLKSPIKEGFYGNFIGVACAMSTINELTTKPLSEIVHLVQMARKSISEEYIRSTIDYLEVKKPTKLEFSGKLGITHWTRFSLYETDFGWGIPIYAGPIDLSPFPQLCLFLPHHKESGSIIVCICLPLSSISSFKFFLMKKD
ncbi:hypothetical protein SUGI_0954570 [Cryptomeria japonica]|uniref:omega-hydroxypalmitate O-feruloyl transferase n=1 Tax=Cryptomeria japonica TaxID=3369 RepID=UPI0024149FB5|nr:omega-hydroxypalmitate O-feruloyl transferase [Cryptomeria japonica]GLJ45351.1 hypothetical protein SUGI_0954570 [Cryptomeria japonica]